MQINNADTDDIPSYASTDIPMQTQLHELQPSCSNFHQPVRIIIRQVIKQRRGEQYIRTCRFYTFFY